MMRVPKHVAIIMDGNGRWAKKQGKVRSFGHSEGAKKIDFLLDHAANSGIETLTLYALSSENLLSRSKIELDFLIRLFGSLIDAKLSKLIESNVKVRFIGDVKPFPRLLQKKIKNLEVATAANDRIELVVAVNYSGRWDILQATQKILNSHIDSPSGVSSELFESMLSTSGLRDPDLLIRTGGDSRISNFLLWQLSYTELYFSPLLWPDFDEAAFDQALDYFAACSRRFGAVLEEA